jgi:DNA repair protein NreA
VGPDDVLSRIDPRLCVACKGARALCGIDPCPLLARVRHHLPQIQVKARDLWGSSPPSLFVGRHGYPNVGIGPMLPPQHLEDEAAQRLDDPAGWMDELTIPDIVGMRSGLMRTTHKVRIRGPADRITQLTQELAMAARPVDTEVRLAKVPRFAEPTVAEFTAPHGPTIRLERARLGENVRVERRIEAVVSDTDLRAADGLADLYQNGTDIYQLERLLSAGLLGHAPARKLVPTRWSITATDDAVGMRLAERVRQHPTLDKPTLHVGERFGNRFFVLLLPRAWGFELVEAWLKGAFWAREPVMAADHEDHAGRSQYAENTAGGYYATRLGVLEHLDQARRQATAIVLREIDDRYTTPLGVWVVRETVRRVMATRGLIFEDLQAALRHIDRHARAPWQAHAPFLRLLRQQRTLGSFM